MSSLFVALPELPRKPREFLGLASILPPSFVRELLTLSPHVIHTTGPIDITLVDSPLLFSSLFRSLK